MDLERRRREAAVVVRRDEDMVVVVLGGERRVPLSVRDTRSAIFGVILVILIKISGNGYGHAY